MTRFIATVMCLLSVRVAAGAQLLEARDAPLVYSHHHLNVTDVGAHVKFFAGTLGGVPATVAGQQIVKFPNVFVFLRQQKPTGGSRGSAVDHIGFSVPALAPVLDRVKGNGFRVVAGATSAPGRAFVMAPDDLLVELVEVKAQKASIALHHVHFTSPDLDHMQTWYGTVIRVKPTPGPDKTLSLPGVRLEFSAARAEVAPTKGRVLDHVGFEIDNLELFVDRLEDIGAPLASLQRMPGLGIPTAFVTDPWGTSVEFTEGLAKIR